MSGVRVAALALAGLAVAALLGLSGYLVARETIALPATSLSAGERLAPPPATSRRAVGAPARTVRRPSATATAAASTTATGGRAEAGDDRRRRRRGRGDGTSGSGSGSGDASTSSDDSGRGRGRGRGRGGDD